MQIDVTDTASLLTSIERSRRGRNASMVSSLLWYRPSHTSYRAHGRRRLTRNGRQLHRMFMTATAAAREMMKYGCKGSICLVASMSGIIANKGMASPVYDSSKAAVIQLARSLAMEWAAGHDGRSGKRVNSLSPGHVMTPTVQQVLEHNPGMQEIWKTRTWSTGWRKQPHLKARPFSYSARRAHS